MKPIRITAEEFRSAPERYLILARSKVVLIVESHEKEWILSSAEHYADLCRRSDPVAMPVEGLSEADLKELEKSEIPEKTRELDRLLPKNWPEQE